MKKSFLSILAVIFSFALNTSTFAAETKELPKDVKRVSVTFSGGHDTDPRDGGRPVVLIAAALGVPNEVFRDAFSRVHPADTAKGPTGDEARKNKAALMGALGKHGVTNDRLDEVSNYYRYVRSKGDLWKHKDAVANALVKDGKVVGYEIVKGGAGYSSTPTVTVPDIKGPAPKIQIAYGKNLETNGSVAAITLP